MLIVVVILALVVLGWSAAPFSLSEVSLCLQGAAGASDITP